MLGLGTWLRRRRRSAEDAAQLDETAREQNEAYREQHGSPLSSPARVQTGFWNPEGAEESEFKPPKY